MDKRDRLKLAALSEEIIPDTAFEKLLGDFQISSEDDATFVQHILGKYRPKCGKKILASIERFEVANIASLDDLNRWLLKKGLAVLEKEHGFELQFVSGNAISFLREGGTENPDPPHPEDGSRDWLVLRVSGREIRRK